MKDASYFPRINGPNDHLLFKAFYVCIFSRDFADDKTRNEQGIPSSVFFFLIKHFDILITTGSWEPVTKPDSWELFMIARTRDEAQTFTQVMFRQAI